MSETPKRHQPGCPLQAVPLDVASCLCAAPPLVGEREHVTDGIDCWCRPTCQTPDGRELSRTEAQMKNAVGEVMVIVHNEVKDV